MLKRLDGEMSITQNLFDVLVKLFPASEYPRVLEIGSGVGTAHWVDRGYQVATVEHDKEWVGSVEGADYFHSDLIDRYYDKTLIKSLLQARRDIWIIDGPPGNISDRTQIIPLIYEVRPNKPRVIVVDDIHRGDGSTIIQNLWQFFEGPPIFTVHNTRYGGSRHESGILLLRD